MSGIKEEDAAVLRQVEEAGPPKVPSWMLSLSEPIPTSTSTSSSSSASASSSSSNSSSSSAASVGADSKDEEGDESFPAPLAGRSDGSERAALLKAGFRLVEFAIRDARTGEVLWKAVDPDEDGALFSEEVEAHLPRKTLSLPVITRSITFSSRESMKDFRLVQRTWLGEAVVELHEFKFGFVIPNSTNSWETDIQAAAAAPGEATDASTGNASSAATEAAEENAASATAMVDPDQVSGHVLVETCFYDGETLITTAVVRIFYI